MTRRRRGIWTTASVVMGNFTEIHDTQELLEFGRDYPIEPPDMEHDPALDIEIAPIVYDTNRAEGVLRNRELISLTTPDSMISSVHPTPRKELAMTKQQNRGWMPDPPEMTPMPFVEELKPITHFHGKRDSEGICHLYKSNDEYQVEILPDRSQKVYNHSPDGFERGYGGSGPSQLSLAIMLEATDDDRKALNLYQGFKFDVVSGLPYAEWTIPIEKIEAWITSQADDNLDDIPY